MINILKNIYKLRPVNAFLLGLVLAIVFSSICCTFIILQIKFGYSLEQLALPILGIITSYIAYQQWTVNQNKLRLDLYEKRYKVFDAIMKLCAEVIQNGNISLDTINFYNIETNSSEFIFGEEIKEHISTIRIKAFRLRHINERLDDNYGLPVGEERTSLANESSELTVWFEQQLTNNRTLFKKYLQFNI